MLSPHPTSPLEYWFFKVNAGRVALIVDWIARRKKNENVLRASIHSPQKREVVFETLGDGNPSLLTTEHTSGKAGEVEWKLDLDIAGGWIKPSLFPASELQLFDMTIVSAPSVKFTGWIRHGQERFELQGARGMVSHYWGRRLPREWWWVSANQFDRAEVAVECMVLRSGVWGVPLGLRLGYLFFEQNGKRRLWIAPPASVHAVGSPESFEIQFGGPGGRPVRLAAHGRDYGDFGQRIINTLTGDLEIWEGERLIARAEKAAGLERRAPGDL